MINVRVILKDKADSKRFISMNMDEYMQFIKEQAKLLNVKEETKPLTRNLERSHPGIKHPGSYPTDKIKKDYGITITTNAPDEKDVEEIAKQISKKINLANTKGEAGC